jgi:hypothetical protein
MKSALLAALLTLPLHAGTPPAGQPVDESLPAFRLFDGLQRSDADVELLTGGGISVFRSAAAYEQKRNDWTFTAGTALSSISIDYEPSIVTSAADRRDYDGFSDYRSLWIAEYYDQFTGFLPGYEKADPHGWSVNAGAAWEYLPRTAKLTASLSYGYDHIVPAWSPLGAAVSRSRDALGTLTGSLAWEAALTPAVKMEHTLRVTDTAGRELRWQARSEFAWAATDRLTFRAEAGGAMEDPTFEALFAGLSAEYAFTGKWRAGLSARIYDDTGELETANFDTAAPGVTTRELSAHLLWSSGTTSVRLSAGVLDASYDGLSDDNLFFGNLYRDRDFFTTRLAITHVF